MVKKKDFSTSEDTSNHNLTQEQRVVLKVEAKKTLHEMALHTEMLPTTLKQRLVQTLAEEIMDYVYGDVKVEIENVRKKIIHLRTYPRDWSTPAKTTQLLLDLNQELLAIDAHLQFISQTLSTPSDNGCVYRPS